MNHLGGINILVELLGRAEVEFQSGFLEALIVDVRIVRNLRSVHVADEGRQGRNEHEGALHQVVQTLLIGRNACDAVDFERLHHVGEVLDRLDEVVGDHWLEDVQLEVALACGKVDAGGVPHHLNRNHSDGFALGRIDLARHDRGAGS